LADEFHSFDETLWSGIMRLVKAHSLKVMSSGLGIARYWELDLFATLPHRKDEEYVEHYRALLFDAVRRRSRSHKPVAYEVSGGLDSSAVFCVADRLGREGRLPAPDMRGYTLDFSNDAEEPIGPNELRYARAVGEHLGRPVQEVPPAIEDVSWYAERAKTWRDFPGYPNGVMSKGVFEQASVQGAAALLTGQGGDHILDGSRAYYAEELARGHLVKLYNCFKADVEAAGLARASEWAIRYGALALLPEAAKAALRPWSPWRPREPAIARGYWLSPRLRETLDARRAAHRPPNRPGARKGQARMIALLDYPFDSVAFEHIGRLAAGSGLESRHPFFDLGLVQFLFSTPERLKLRGDCNKFIHKRALQGILPRAICARATKAEFGATFVPPLRALQDGVFERISRERADWLDRGGAARLFQSFVDRPEAGEHQWPLWGIVGCHFALPAAERVLSPAAGMK
jgi:asparagine synthase (glutamine-hydrolysing)